jgi:hypothetical protein
VRAIAAPVAIEAKRPLYGIPVRGSALDYDAMIKTVGAALITPAGVSVPIQSVLGGNQTNLPAGTLIRWDPRIPELEQTSTIVAPGLTLGTAPTFFGGVHQIKMHEQLGPSDVAQQLFECKLGRFPALVLLWDSSSPYGDANGRRGVGARLLEERWLLAVIASRVDSSEQRRQEALQILEDARSFLTDRSETEDHEIITAPTGILISSCRRIVVTNTSYVYGIAFSTTHTLARREWRTFNPWLRTRVDLGPVNEPEPPIIEMS